MISRLLYQLYTQQNNYSRCWYHHNVHICCYLLQTINEGYNCIENTSEESWTAGCASIFLVYIICIMIIKCVSSNHLAGIAAFSPLEYIESHKICNTFVLTFLFGNIEFPTYRYSIAFISEWYHILLHVGFFPEQYVFIKPNVFL